jgi:hypothetical protein
MPPLLPRRQNPSSSAVSEPTTSSREVSTMSAVRFEWARLAPDRDAEPMPKS